MTHTKGFLAAFRLSCQHSFTSESCSPFEFLPQTTVCHQQPAYQLGRHTNSTSGGLVARAPSSWRVCSRVSPVPVLPCQSQVGVCQVRFPLPASRMLSSCLHQQGPVQLAGQDQVRGLCYLRASPSLLTFKAKLKSNLFRQAVWLICTHLLLPVSFCILQCSGGGRIKPGPCECQQTLSTWRCTQAAADVTGPVATPGNSCSTRRGAVLAEGVTKDGCCRS